MKPEHFDKIIKAFDDVHDFAVERLEDIDYDVLYELLKECKAYEPKDYQDKLDIGFLEESLEEHLNILGYIDRASDDVVYFKDEVASLFDWD